MRKSGVTVIRGSRGEMRRNEEKVGDEEEVNGEKCYLLRRVTEGLPIVISLAYVMRVECHEINS
jgi:hypothetical protein